MMHKAQLLAVVLLLRWYEYKKLAEVTEREEFRCGESTESAVASAFV